MIYSKLTWFNHNIKKYYFNTKKVPFLKIGLFYYLKFNLFYGFTFSLQPVINKMMNFFTLTNFLLSCLAGLSTIIISFHLYKTYQFRYLSTYFCFLISFNIYGFFNIICIFMVYQTLVDYSPEVIMTVANIFYFIGFPFLFVQLYFFINFTSDLIEKKLPVAIKMIYISFWSILFLFFLFFIINYSLTQDNLFPENYSRIIAITASIFFYVTICNIFFNLKAMKDKKKKKSVKISGLLFLSGYTLYFLAALELVYKSYMQYASSLLYFTVNLPLLLYLRRFLYYYHIEQLLLPENLVDINHFYKRHNISSREKEIILLILKGKSNKEIEDELYISIKTVKNHIYSIYKKLGVKKRSQLINAIQNSL